MQITGTLSLLMGRLKVFHSTRGVKQGDPLSPTLFILITEVLSKSLNSLFDNSEFKGYAMPKWSDNINHLAYANDTIIFVSTEKKSSQLVMQVLNDYEEQSGQLINKEKSSFVVYHKIAHAHISEIEECTSFIRGKFPLIYLWCPIGHAKK